MTRPNQPTTLESRVARLEARLHALDVGRASEHTTIQAGVTTVRDRDGVLRAAMGDLDDDGVSYGFEIVQGGVMRIRDENGNIRLVLGDPLGDSETYGIDLYEGGLINVRDITEAIRASMGDLDGDGTTFGFLVGRGGRFEVRNTEGVTVGVLGDLDDDGSLYGVRLYRGGVQEVRDEAAVLRVRMGDLDADGPAGNFGLQVWDGLGGSRFKADNDGLHDPWLQMNVFDSINLKTTTNGTFEEMWRAQAGLESHKGIHTYVFWVVDAATTGEIRMTMFDGSHETETRTLTGSNELINWKWLHGQALGTGPIVVKIEARRTSGAGNVHVYQPAEMSLSSPEGCSEDGVPV